MFSHDTLIKCKGKCLAFFYEGGTGASPKAVCRSPKDFRPSKMLAHSNRKIILVIYQVSQEKKYTKLIKRNLKVDIKHLKNTKVYSIEFLRTEMTSDPSN